MENEQQSIGMASMDEKRTITLKLRAEDGTGIQGNAQFTYPLGHERYQEMIDHLGGLNPGEQKLVPPWPS